RLRLHRWHFRRELRELRACRQRDPRRRGSPRLSPRSPRHHAGHPHRDFAPKPGLNLSAILRRIDLYEKLLRLDKPIGTLLLLWPTLWALWLSASGRPNWRIVWIFA